MYIKLTLLALLLPLGAAAQRCGDFYFESSNKVVTAEPILLSQLDTTVLANTRHHALVAPKYVVLCLSYTAQSPETGLPMLMLYLNHCYEEADQGRIALTFVDGTTFEMSATGQNSKPYMGSEQLHGYYPARHQGLQQKIKQNLLKELVIYHVSEDRKLFSVQPTPHQQQMLMQLAVCLMMP